MFQYHAARQGVAQPIVRVRNRFARGGELLRSVEDPMKSIGLQYARYITHHGVELASRLLCSPTSGGELRFQLPKDFI